jgi:hypothetical protein
MNMQHFEVQIEHNTPVSKETLDSIVKTQLDDKFLSSEDISSIKEYFSDKEGQRVFYFILENQSGTNTEIVKLFETEIDSQPMIFDRMCGSLPRFISTRPGSTKKHYKAYHLNKFKSWMG